jgi:glycolate oxidase
VNNELIRALRAFLPPESVLTDTEDLRPFECDGLSAYRQLPMLVVLPETIEQVQSIMRLCHAHQVPVVARGAGTGLSGGALPLADGVLLSLAKFKKIINIDAANAMATVQPGVRKPERAQVVLAAFNDVVKAGEAVGSIIAAGIIPAGLEMMDRLAIQAAEDFVHAGYPRDAEAILLCELDGTNAEVSEYILAVRKILSDSGATEVRTAVDEAERQLFWKGRKSAFPAVGRLAPDYYCMDGTIPRRQLPHVLRRISELSLEYGLPVANVFHAGDGNLHPLILFDANQPGELERTEEFGQRILLLCVEVGGTITGEHGVGIEKIGQMCVQFGTAELNQFHAIKAAFDPSGLLNPGKAVPTLQRCAEFGAMHVHHGQLPHPELERF